MRSRVLRIFFVVLLLTAAPYVMSSQAKLYTKKARLEDFPIKLLKVVADGESPLAIDLKNEISSRWRLSPFEFCQSSDYESLREDNNFYFLRFVKEEGIVFLLLEKGGKEGDDNRFKRPFEVVRTPVGITNLDVFIDIIQTYVREAMTSDKYGYVGLDVYNTINIKGRKIDLDANPDDAFAAGEPDILVPMFFVPEPEGMWCYKMLIDSGTHELFFFDRAKYKNESDAAFTALELKSFELRHGVILE